MAVNDLSFNQISTVLAEIVGQATGKNVTAPVNTGEFVTVAQTALKTGYDPLSTAISQVLSRTIFSQRAYNRRFRGLEADSIRYGNHVRKLNPVDKPFEDDDRLLLVDGESVDQFRVNKIKTLQTNFYGANVYQKCMTIYRDQLDCAFSSEEEFRSFLAMMMGNAQDMIEQAHETTARGTILNLIGGTIASGNTPQVIHLLTEYKEFIGESGAYNVYDPSNFPMFARWLFGRIKTLSQSMEERSYIYHANVADNEVARHSPVRDQRLFIFTPDINTVDATVLSTTFNDDYLKLLPYEGVTFWQSISDPKSIDIECAYMDDTGAIVTGVQVQANDVLGVLIDREAAGYTVVNRWSQPSPFNARGGYYNQFWHFTDRYWNDYSENCVVLKLD